MHYGLKTTDKNIIEFMKDRNVSKTIREGLKLVEQKELESKQKELEKIKAVPKVTIIG